MNNEWRNVASSHVQGYSWDLNAEVPPISTVESVRTCLMCSTEVEDDRMVICGPCGEVFKLARSLLLKKMAGELIEDLS